MPRRRGVEFQCSFLCSWPQLYASRFHSNEVIIRFRLPACSPVTRIPPVTKTAPSASAIKGMIQAHCKRQGMKNSVAVTLLQNAAQVLTLNQPSHGIRQQMTRQPKMTTIRSDSVIGVSGHFESPLRAYENQMMAVAQLD